MPRENADKAAIPNRLEYSLAAYSIERRDGAWYAISKVDLAFRHRPKWLGPFETIDTICISIARHLAADIADSHTRDIERLQLEKAHPLYGLNHSHRLDDFVAPAPRSKS